ncbi:MAG: hypothetical protein AAFO15_01775, partial [Pseudomonadota bacterium]
MIKKNNLDSNMTSRDYIHKIPKKYSTKNLKNHYMINTLYKNKYITKDNNDIQEAACDVVNISNVNAEKIHNTSSSVSDNRDKNTDKNIKYVECDYNTKPVITKNLKYLVGHKNIETCKNSSNHNKSIDYNANNKAEYDSTANTSSDICDKISNKNNQSHHVNNVDSDSRQYDMASSDHSSNSNLHQTSLENIITNKKELNYRTGRL